MAYAKTILFAGVIIPVFLHIIAPHVMPWWPDTVSLGIASGVVGVVMVSQARKDREMNRRMWNALKALARRWGPR